MATFFAATGWQAHTARGFMSGGLGRKLGLTMTPDKEASSRLGYRLNHAAT